MDRTETIARSGRVTVFDLFRARALHAPDRIALTEDGQSWTYGETEARVLRLARGLVERGVTRGDRIALLSENRREYAEIELAAASIGAIVACQNWRLAADELRHCITLVSPSLVLVSDRHRAAWGGAGAGPARPGDRGGLPRAPGLRTAGGAARGGSGGRAGDPLYLRHHGAAQGRADLPPGPDRTDGGLPDGHACDARGRLRRLGADVPHGLHRPGSGDPDGGGRGPTWSTGSTRRPSSG